MPSKVFVDANLFLDLTLQRAGHLEASAIIQLRVDGKIQIYTTPAVLHIVAYFTSQHYTATQTKQIILTLLNDVQIIDCDHITAITALNNNFDDTEDALQYFAALREEVDYFVSSDRKLRKSAIPQLPVYAAAELLAELNQSV